MASPDDSPSRSLDDLSPQSPDDPPSPQSPADSPSPRSSDDPSSRPSADPSLTARLVGGLQWAITGSYLFLFGFLLLAWYLSLTGTMVSLDASRAFGVFVLAAFAAGFLWVGSQAAAPGAHARRIEVVVTLLVLGFVLPFGVPPVLDALGMALPLPLFGFGVAYALALALSYGLVYGLGTRFFLGPDPELLE